MDAYHSLHGHSDSTETLISGPGPQRLSQNSFEQVERFPPTSHSWFEVRANEFWIRLEQRHRGENHRRTSSVNQNGSTDNSGDYGGDHIMGIRRAPQLGREPDVLEVLFRSWRLQEVYNFFARMFRKDDRVEHPKPAVSRNLAYTMTSYSVHLIPAGVALGLVVLNMKGLYIGGELSGPSGDFDSVKLGGLQIAAKLHELLIQASLSFVILGIIRRELVGGEGVPFGIVTACLELTNVSWLWSKELAGVWRSRYNRKWKKWFLMLLIIVGILLTATVGPSTAILMRPRDGTWPAGGCTFQLSATSGQLWTENVGYPDDPSQCANVSISGESTECISEGWKSIADNYLSYWNDLSPSSTLPEETQLDGLTSLRILLTRARLGLYRNQYTLATVPMANLADQVAEIGRLWTKAAVHSSKRFQFRKDVNYSISDIHQPLVQTRCALRYYDSSNSSSIKVPMTETLCAQADYMGLTSYTDEDVLKPVLDRYNHASSTMPTLEFFKTPNQTEYNNTSIGGLITIPQMWPGGRKILGCQITAVWAPSNVYSQRSQMKVVHGDPGGWAADWLTTGLCGQYGHRIRIDPSWARLLNPNLQQVSQDVFQTLVNSVSIDDKFLDLDFVEPYFESILSAMVASGLSRNYNNVSSQGPLRNDYRSLLLPKGVFGYSDEELYELPPTANMSEMSKFTAKVDISGYAYRFTGWTTILSCVVLLCYIAAVLAYGVLCLIDRIHSTAWENISEWTALAMQSRPTPVLRNTSAGINSSGVFSSKVKVRQRTSVARHLELRFEEDDNDNTKPLVYNEHYA